MAKKTLLLAAATLGLAASFGSAPSSAQSTDIIYLNAANDIKAGRRALRQDRPADAIRLFEKGLKKKIPDRLRVVGLNDLCIAFRFEGDLAAAKESCTQAIALNPRYWRAYNNRANVHYDQKNYLAALSDYEAALALNPKSDLLRQNIGALAPRVTLAE